jgi:predicted NBD/HSP70 family sugar kinase
MKKATRQQIKNHNSQLVLRTIYRNKDISRAEIARSTRLTRPTISTIVGELIATDYVFEAGLGDSAGGKRPTLLRVAYDRHQMISLDLGRQHFHGAVVDLSGRIQHRQSIALNGCQDHAAFELIHEHIANLLACTEAPILGIGVGTPGLTNPEAGVVREALNLGWSELPIRDILEKRFNLPVYVANDSHIAALGEHTFGRQRESQNLIAIKIGQGVSAGIILNGQLYYGDGYSAGEIGHVAVIENGRRCTCGNSGCLETTTSTRAIMKQAQEMYGSAQSWVALVQALKNGEGQARKIVESAGRHLGIAVANLIGSLNIRRIVISGRVEQFGEPFLTAIRQEAGRRFLPAIVDETELSYSSLGRDNVILGSTAMIMKQELGIV